MSTTQISLLIIKVSLLRCRIVICKQPTTTIPVYSYGKTQLFEYGCNISVWSQYVTGYIESVTEERKDPRGEMIVSPPSPPDRTSFSRCDVGLVTFCASLDDIHFQAHGCSCGCFPSGMNPMISAFFGKVKIAPVDLRGNGTHCNFLRSIAVLMS